ncbi:MAG: 3-deoxy-D-manno-octulosonic acid transferase [Candidatus Scalindua rubra]|uniref:3-deoxy-D-manno-octulosonic acid transferase n=1 Tax=Candidatus Scalindua rubra TaxID=1872076 RepID=A0A1E3X8U1_9BACT|nr:MAG: 3-deoxy-D-manno-octulosonic acid transferase [Candidatus Scalindua rubra]
MPLLFDSIYLTASVLGSPYLLFKMLSNERYRAGLNQRFGVTTERVSNKPGIWIHGASVGEVITAKSIVEKTDEEFPEWETFISTSTNTGFSVAKKNFCNKTVFYFPVDLSWITKKALLQIKPSCIILIELEIWPNFLVSAYKKNIPVIIVNGRISNKSFITYRTISLFSKIFCDSLTNEMNTYCARTDLDAQRFRNLRIPSKQVFVTGTMKYDNIQTRIDENIEKELKDLFQIENNDLVLIGGSTHEGEEEILIRVFERLSKIYSNLRLIVVPRHIERTRDVSKLIEKMGFIPVLKTVIEDSNYKWQNTKKEIILINTVGDLGKIYSLANFVFVGRSLVPFGGQNMMEPAGLGKPVVFGPHIFNFKEEVNLLLQNGAAKMVETEEELFKTIEFFIMNPDAAKEMGLKAQKVVNEKRGATERNMDIIREILKNKSSGRL